MSKHLGLIFEWNLYIGKHILAGHFSCSGGNFDHYILQHVSGETWKSVNKLLINQIDTILTTTQNYTRNARPAEIEQENKLEGKFSKRPAALNDMRDCSANYLC